MIILTKTDLIVLEFIFSRSEKHGYEIERERIISDIKLRCQRGLQNSLNSLVFLKVLDMSTRPFGFGHRRVYSLSERGFKLCELLEDFDK